MFYNLFEDLDQTICLSHIRSAVTLSAVSERWSLFVLNDSIALVTLKHFRCVIAVGVDGNDNATIPV